MAGVSTLIHGFQFGTHSVHSTVVFLHLSKATHADKIGTDQWPEQTGLALLARNQGESRTTETWSS